MRYRSREVILFSSSLIVSLGFHLKSPLDVELLFGVGLEVSSLDQSCIASQLSPGQSQKLTIDEFFGPVVALFALNLSCWNSSGAVWLRH